MDLSSIHLLEFGNVTMFALIVWFALSCACLLNWVAIEVIRFSLNLDSDNAPKIFQKVHIADLCSKILDKLFFETKPAWTYELRQSGYYPINHMGEYWGYRSDIEGVEAFLNLENRRDETYTIFKDHSIVSVIAILLGADVVLYWATHDLFSLLVVSATVITPLTLRYLSGTLWSHGVRITKLEESDNDTESAKNK